MIRFATTLTGIFAATLVSTTVATAQSITQEAERGKTQYFVSMKSKLLRPGGESFQSGQSFTFLHDTFTNGQINGFCVSVKSGDASEHVGSIGFTIRRDETFHAGEYESRYYGYNFYESDQPTIMIDPDGDGVFSFQCGEGETEWDKVIVSYVDVDEADPVGMFDHPKIKAFKADFKKKCVGKDNTVRDVMTGSVVVQPAGYLEEKVTQLRAENASLTNQNTLLSEEVTRVQAENARLTQRLTTQRAQLNALRLALKPLASKLKAMSVPQCKIGSRVNTNCQKVVDELAAALTELSK